MAQRNAVSEGSLLWEPSAAERERANLTRYLRWLEETRDLSFDGYAPLWEWSVNDLEGFWSSVWEYFDIVGRRPYEEVLADRSMPGARWFPGAELNYAEHALRRRDDHVAVVAASEAGPVRRLSYSELSSQVAAAAAGLRRLGVGRGDRVAALLPNVPETLIAFLAAASLGAVWSSCSPEFGIGSVVHRFSQIEPKVLLTVDGYRFGGKEHDRISVVAEIEQQLPTLEATVLLPLLRGSQGNDLLPGALPWEGFVAGGEALDFEPVPFDHPLWILYSSGTTGLPKPIVQGHGGILLEHFKELSLHVDLTEQDRFFWYTSTGWMMWNYLIGGLLVESTIVLYDGSPGYPDTTVLWRLAAETEMTYFGTSAPFIQACMKGGLEPGKDFDLTRLRGLGSTGAPLPPEGFAWVYDHVHRDLLLGSVSGGTDLCTAFVGSCPLLPVRAGELQCRQLGAKVEAYDVNGEPVIDEVGELVITAPMPSMPIYFWNDPDGERYRSSYFEMYPGVWRHGDWIKISPEGGCVISGRSDSTLNRGGVRMGSSEFYRVVEDLAEVVDSLVVDTGRLGAEGRLLLFVALQEGVRLDERLAGKIKDALRRDLSPRHVPDEIHQIDEVPRTLNGKKMEVPVKRILAGVPVEEAVRRDAMANPDAIEAFAALVRD